MRLAVIAPHFPEYTLRYAGGLAEYCEVLVCVDEAQLAAEYEGRSIPEEHDRRIERVRFKTLLDLFKILYLTARFKPAIVHFQEAAGPRRGFFVACIATAMKPFARIALTVHDPVPHAGRDAVAARRTAWVRDYVRRLADIVVVHGAHCARLYREGAPRPRCEVVQSEHGLILEPSVVQPNPPPPLKLYFFGRMEAYKGVEVLLAAAELLHAEGAPFELWIEGQGPELDRLQDRFLRLPEVKLHNGFVPSNRIIAAIQATDCVLLPYLSATQSGVLAAAFAGRRYVIASETGGLPDVVEHMENGLLVPPGDSHALAEAIRTVARDEGLRARLRDGADATARVKLDWGRICKELHGVFAGSVGRTAPGAAGRGAAAGRAR